MQILLDKKTEFFKNWPNQISTFFIVLSVHLNNDRFELINTWGKNVWWLKLLIFFLLEEDELIRKTAKQ
jgi:hypothetical protein